MTSVTMLEFRRNARRYLDRVRKGQRYVLTLRGKPVARLEPVEEEYDENDPFFSIVGLIQEDLGSLTNEEIDRIVYRDP